MKTPSLGRGIVALAALAGTMLALAGGAQAGGPANACSKPISMTTGDWPPYNYYDAQGEHRGLDIELVRAVFAEAGCVLVEAAPMPAARNTMLFEQAKVDMMSGASKTPQRQAAAWFSQRYRQEVVSLFVLAERADHYKAITSFDELMQARLSVLAPSIGYYGSDYERYAPQLRSGGKLFQFPAFDQGIRMLIAGRADTILGDVESVVLAAVSQNVQVVALPFALLDAPVFLMFNKKTVPQSDVQRLDAAIARLEKRGALARIRKAYVVY